MLTFGAPVSVHPDVDPLEDIRWADRQPGIEAAWSIDHLRGWYPRGTAPGALADPHRLLDPFAVLAAGATAAERIRLGVAVTDPLRRTGVALAHAASTVSWLGGREFALGIGVGDPGQLRPFELHSGTSRTGRLGYMRPMLDTLSTLRTDGRLAITETAGFGLHIAAHGPRMLELTARHADGWLPTSLPAEHYAERLATVRAHAEAIGRDPGTIRPELFVWTALAPSGAESRALLRHPSVRAVALYRGPEGFARHGAEFPLEQGYNPDDVPPERATELLESIPDAVVADAVLHGSPEQVREQLHAYERAGCEHVICYDIGRFADPEGTERFRAGMRSVLAA
ncbi:LLM class flavin-dependent oxidoreductase [Sciscionella sediminilitoris]|uniref:LLM class flavin-dependent oxidoreductase n=1 Tax=Sciscionella sediminilitoris TaxID=1445613 RepID=UPI00056D7D76|nr:LLM class flavin-dependent oxidoreductase [Sciscionella sp. SE31]